MAMLVWLLRSLSAVVMAMAMAMAMATSSPMPMAMAASASSSSSSSPSPSAHAQFAFNGFHHNISEMNLSGFAVLDPSGMIRLTNLTSRHFGHALHASPILTKPSSSFSFATTFVFSIFPLTATIGGHGFAFWMTPTLNTASAFPSQYLGMLNASNNGNASNHIFAVEFDTVQDLEFSDIDDNHVGININNMISVISLPAGYRTGPGPNQTVPINLKSGENIQAWISYNGLQKQLNVTIANVGDPQPLLPLLSVPLDLSSVLEDTVYVGFSGSTGIICAVHNILAWSFSFSTEIGIGTGMAPPLDLSKLPKLPSGKRSTLNVGIIAGFSLFGLTLLSIAVYALLRWCRKRRQIIREEKMEDWDLDYGPHRFSYRELCEATKGFSQEKLLGVGGFGRVYKGVLRSSGVEIAVKRLSHESQQGLQEFLAELSSIGRLRHRNLVQLQGWSRRRGELLLVYDYMPNGSLDKMLDSLSWGQRYGILRGIAAALLYLHEEWEQQVLHRDVKSNNVLLDSDLNGKLGDFGLARLHQHGCSDPHTTRVVGTLGYLAPEFSRTGKATPATDVFGFGALMLEVASGRRPLDSSRPEEESVLVDWLWELQAKGDLMHSVDPKLGGCFEPEEMERVLQTGLLCSHLNPGFRPSMRQVCHILAGDLDVPHLPPPPMLAPISSSYSPIVHWDVLSTSSSTNKSWSRYDTNTSAVSAR